MKDEEREQPDSGLQEFTDHLADLAAVRKQDAAGYFPIARLASQIIADPRAHMDALVEAKVLCESEPETWTFRPQPKPHVHEPYAADGVVCDGTNFYTRCECGASSLPIEWPDQ
jgi:hypothetical protein